MSDGDGSTFVWKSEYDTIMIWTAVGPAIASLVASAVVLALATVIWLDLRTRRFLRRQSLQMLLWVQGASIIYNGSYMYAQIAV